MNYLYKCLLMITLLSLVRTQAQEDPLEPKNAQHIPSIIITKDSIDIELNSVKAPINSQKMTFSEDEQNKRRYLRVPSKHYQSERIP